MSAFPVKDARTPAKQELRKIFDSLKSGSDDDIDTDAFVDMVISATIVEITAAMLGNRGNNDRR